MRNKYPGRCYRCGTNVAVGQGHFERFAGGWRTQHATCAIAFRGKGDAARDRYNEKQRERHDEIAAQGTGRSAQRARKRIRDSISAHFSVLD